MTGAAGPIVSSLLVVAVAILTLVSVALLSLLASYFAGVFWRTGWKNPMKAWVEAMDKAYKRGKGEE